MGIPKFFRWLSERYPKINQRETHLPSPDTCQEYYGTDPPEINNSRHDPLSRIGVGGPEIDRLYIDGNGILHGCSHNNNDDENEGDHGITNEEICVNVCYYLDRVISDMVKPTELVYIALDGVAPRAKLNQQRARRYRGGDEELELTIYEDYMTHNDNNDKRLTGKYETSTEKEKDDDEDAHRAFHSNCITPGTEFFSIVVDHIQHWLEYKISTDPRWKDLRIIFSGPNVPGEGEHKIMSFIRNERLQEGYNPNTRHAIMGQDADLILLGLATHEPNFCIFRERVLFNFKQRMLLKADNDDDGNNLDTYLHNSDFEWLHMSVLRDYLMFELELPGTNFCLERTLDDIIFCSFLVGNDFLPHLPALDIGDEAMDLIFHVYKKERRSYWKSQQIRQGKDPYLTNSGSLVCPQRLEHFLLALGSHEESYYEEKKTDLSSRQEKIRKMDEKMGWESTLPPGEVIDQKEDADRARYRSMMMEHYSSCSDNKKDIVVSDNANALLWQQQQQSQTFTPEKNDLEQGFMSRLNSLLQSSISTPASTSTSSDDKSKKAPDLDDQDIKGRYYYDKFQIRPFDKEKHRSLRKAYLEGLLWNLQYYFAGCPSWSWYYPYHYGPMLSDCKDLSAIFKELEAERSKKRRDNTEDAPFRPYEQLLGCLPPSSSYLLPKPYRKLMISPDSPLKDFYPKSFMVDMNGKRWSWEATVLLPFFDAKRLQQAAKPITNELTPSELERNSIQQTMQLRKNKSSTAMEVVVQPKMTDSSRLEFIPKCFQTAFSRQVQEDVLEEVSQAETLSTLLPGVQTPSPGFPTLCTAPIRSLWRRRMGINVFGSKSRYRTAVLDTAPTLPPSLSLDQIASQLIGTIVYFNYPYLSDEGFVTAVADKNHTIRGDTYWVTLNDVNEWNHDAIAKQLEYGEGLTGTGGWRLPPSDILVTVRPLWSVALEPTASKRFAPFEVTLPLMAVLWSPTYTDPRTHEIPLALEIKDPYLIENHKTKLKQQNENKAVATGETASMSSWPLQQKQQKRQFNTSSNEHYPFVAATATSRPIRRGRNLLTIRLPNRRQGLAAIPFLLLSKFRA